MNYLTVEELLEMDSAHLKIWVESSFLNGSEFHKNFNWLGLADSLALEARNNATEKQISLAETAVTIYEWLGDKQKENQQSYKNSANSLRTYLIVNKVVDFYHPLLGIKNIEMWFWEGVDITPLESLKLSKAFKKKIQKSVNNQSLSSINELKKMNMLRSIKNKLQIIKNLPTTNLFDKSKEIQEWLKIKDELL